MNRHVLRRRAELDRRRARKGEVQKGPAQRVGQMGSKSFRRWAKAHHRALLDSEQKFERSHLPKGYSVRQYARAVR